MVISMLLGGMGNQMFQYAIGKHLAILNETDLRLDTSVLLDWSAGRHAVNRDYSLGIFNLKVERASASEVARYNPAPLNIKGKINYRIKKQLFGDMAIKEKSFQFDPGILYVRRPIIYLSGLWQSYKYFQSIEDQILSDFSFKFPLKSKTLKLAEKIRSSNSVCINVRRGDFINVENTRDMLGFVGIEYYRNSVDYLNARFEGLNYYIFSDEPEWCKRNINFIKGPIQFVTHDYAGEKFSDYLQLMTLCKYYIIPNSTFAWWGAWLNRNPDKIAIAPKFWFKDDSINTDDLIPKEWIRF